MAQFQDARLNEFQGALDAINGLTLTDARTAVNTLNSNGSVTLDIVGKSTMFIDVRCTVTFNAATALTVEGTVDGVNFFALPFFFAQSNDQTNFPAEAMAVTLGGANVTAGDIFLLCCSVTGFRTVRVRMAFTTAGTATIAMRATQADYRIIAQPQPSLIAVTATAAAGAAATATLTGVAGLFHYITSVQLDQYISVALTPNAAPVLTVPTNVVPIWTLPTLAGGVGELRKIVDMTYSNPLKSTTAGSTTSFASPAQAGAIYRWNVQYYLGA